jgi:cell division septal protein FtsQ
MTLRPLPVSKLRAKRRKRRLLFILGTFVVVLLLFAMLVGVTWLPFLRITTVTVVGASSVNTANAEEIVRQRINDQYFFIIARDNILLYPKSETIDILKRKFPVIENIEIRHSGLNALTVTITERTTRALWCGESPSSPSPCFLLDKDGVAYAPAADFSGSVYVKYYGAISKSTTKQFVTPDEFHALSAVVSSLRSQVEGDAPIAAAIKDGDVHIDFSSGFELIYSSKDSGADVLERFTLARQAEPFTKHALSDFEYLDLRFGDKLYYKLK